MARGVLDRARIGSNRLDEDVALAAAPHATSELGDHREGALLGAEVGEAQGGVGVEHHAQRDVGEVVALGDHLGTDQHTRGCVLEAAQQRGDASRRGRRDPGAGRSSARAGH